MKTKQAIPKDVSLILHRQKKRLAELNRLEKWSESEFEEVIRCSTIWSTELQGWVFPLAAAEKLAFDARTPDKQANSWQLIAFQMNINLTGK